MSFLYFDCFSGVSGDMLIGALLDCGASFEELHQAVLSLPISVNVSYNYKMVQGIRSAAFTVDAPHTAPIRHLADITEIVSSSSVSAEVKTKSLRVFTRLAEAEAKVHGVSPDTVHFHEIGAVDTIVDILGTFLCLESLGVDEIYASPLPWSGGLINIGHGRYPLPAPATALLLANFPCVFTDAGIELVTPTGAALLTSIANPLINPPPFIPQNISYGAGTYIRKDNVPNLLRVVKADWTSSSEQEQTVGVLETEIDDLNPEIFTHLAQLFNLHDAVLDYFTTPVYMKKNRPGTLLTLITRPEHVKTLARMLIQESGSLGIRYRLQNRYVVPRSESCLDTPWGTIRVKIARLPLGGVRIKPEFDDCQAIALLHNMPLLEVYSVINELASRLPVK